MERRGRGKERESERERERKGEGKGDGGRWRWFGVEKGICERDILRPQAYLSGNFSFDFPSSLTLTVNHKHNHPIYTPHTHTAHHTALT